MAHVEQLLPLLDREPEELKQVLPEVREEFERRYKSWPLVARFQVALVSGREVA